MVHILSLVLFSASVYMSHELGEYQLNPSVVIHFKLYLHPAAKLNPSHTNELNIFRDKTDCGHRSSDVRQWHEHGRAHAHNTGHSWNYYETGHRGNSDYTTQSQEKSPQHYFRQELENVWWPGWGLRTVKWRFSKLAHWGTEVERGHSDPLCSVHVLLHYDSYHMRWVLSSMRREDLRDSKTFRSKSLSVFLSLHDFSTFSFLPKLVMFSNCSRPITKIYSNPSLDVTNIFSLE